MPEEEVPRAVIDDGEFWICLKDFMTFFSQTTICSLTPDFDMDGSSDSLSMTTVFSPLLSFCTFRSCLFFPCFFSLVSVSDLAQARRDLTVAPSSRNVFFFTCEEYSVN